MEQQPITLHESDDAKVVQLSGEYHPASFYENINELKVIFTAGGIELYRFADPEENKRFGMSTQEADAFVAAWETFKAGQELKRLTEEKRIAGIVLEAHKHVEGLPITIEEHTDDGDRYWNIICPQASHLNNCAYSPEALLERIKNTVVAHQGYLADKVLVDEAFALAESCPAITIDGYKEGTAWRTVMQNPGFLKWVHSGKELLDTVQEAKAKYEQWQFEQDELIKSND